MDQDTTDLLQCSICMSQFKDPKFLNCHHTFCASCLEPILKKYSSKKIFPCPLCRKSNDIPAEGVNGFQENFYLSKILNNKGKASTHRTCDICNDKTPIYKCIICNVSLCEVCKTVHNRERSTRDHAIVLINAVKNLPNCEIHVGSKVKHYCMFCKQKICRQCREELHEGHDIEYITVAAERERLNMREVSGNVRTYLKSFEKTIDEVKLEYKRMNNDMVTIRNTAYEYGEKVKQGIDESLAAFDKYLGQQRKSCKDELVTFASQQQERQKQTSEILRLLEDKLTRDSDVEILDGSRHILRQLLDIVRNRTELPRKEFHFFPREIPFDGWRSIGDVIGSEMPNIAVNVPKKILYTPLFEIKLVSTFESLTGEKRVSSIAPISSKYAWVCYNKSATIYLCSKDGKLKKQISLPGRVEDISVSRDGSLTIVSYQGNTLWKVDKTYTGIVREDKFEYQPRSVICTANGLFGVFVKIMSFLSNKKKFRLAKFDHNMKLVQELAKDEEDESSHMMFHKIAEYSDGDLLTIDLRGPHLGCDLLRLTPTFKISHRRPCQTSSEDSFKPENICCDAYGNTFLTVPERKIVYLMKASDTTFREFLSETHGISHPYSIAVDGADHLWVGDAENGKIHIFKYMK